MRDALHQAVEQNPALKQQLWWSPPDTDRIHPTCIGSRCALAPSPAAKGQKLGHRTTVIRDGALAIAFRGLLRHRFMAELVIGHFQDLASSVLMAHIMAEREGSALPILDQVMLSPPVPSLWLGIELQQRSPSC